MILVTISGPSSTGKTTLLKELRDNDYHNVLESLGANLQFHEELVRKSEDSLEELFKTPKLAMEFQFSVCKRFYSTLCEVVAGSSPSDVIIMDRSPLDSLVYTYLNYSALNENEMITYQSEFSKWCTKLKVVTELVDKYYVTTVDPNSVSNIEKDGFRPTQYSSRRLMEIEMFTSLFKINSNSQLSNNPKVCILPALTEDRIITIMSDLISMTKMNL